MVLLWYGAYWNDWCLVCVMFDVIDLLVCSYALCVVLCCAPLCLRWWYLCVGLCCLVVFGIVLLFV